MSHCVKPSIATLFKSVRRRRFWWSLLGLTLLLLAIAFAPGPVGGCYIELGDYFNTTAGYSFSYLANGHAFSCNEYSDNPWQWGTYKYEKGVGWVLTLRKYDRRTLMKPHLLFIRFSDIDGIERRATAPFQWRNPFLWKTSAVMRRVTLETATNGPILSRDTK
jgi:hypothetical protein